MPDGLALVDLDADALVVAHAVDIDAFTGSATVRVPIPVTPARMGSRPEVALEYSPGVRASAFGVGWSLAGPAPITRRGRSGVPRYGADDDFTFGGDELVRELETGGARPKPRTAQQPGYTLQFYRRRRERAGRPPLRFELWIEDATGRMHWRIRDGANRVIVLGLDASGSTRIADPDDPERVYAWLPEARHDPYGNAERYVYATEDVAGVDPQAAYERPHLDRTQPQRYLKRIRYGNTVPFAPAAAVPAANRWLFELVLDYGDHTGDTPAAAPDRPWTARLDPSSSFTAGFEIRTWRLCRRFLLFHSFPELGSKPQLVEVTKLDHREDPAGSMLRSIGRTGVRREGAGVRTRSLPPLRFTYTAPEVARELRSVDEAAAENVPAGLTGARYRLVDLRGEGLAGILAQGDDAWYYKRNEGGGRFGPQERLAELPLQPMAGVGLADLDRDGDTDFFTLGGQLRGAASFRRDAQRWQGFRSFDTAPRLDGTARWTEWLDVDGDGRTEPVLPGAGRATWWPSDGKDRFAPPRSAPQTREAGAAPFVDAPERNLFFADMNGDGLADQVRVTRGSVEYWPNRGDGRFGEPVAMAGATMKVDGEFDPGRVRFVDLDGSGTSDILYVGRGELRWWTNACGNQLLTGGHLGGLPYADNLSATTVADVLGSGVPCLVWSSPLPGRAHPLQYVPLGGATPPRLLVSVDNSVGGETTLAYTSSSAHYVRDRESEQGWTSLLPVHPVVVETRETIDHVGGMRSRTRYAYRDGFYDGRSRQFRGFAAVDRLEAESDEAGGEPAVRSLSRAWFFTAAPGWARTLAHRYDLDGELTTLPPCTVAGLEQLSDDEFADALETASGELVREETYGVDVAGRPSTHPLHVLQVRQLVTRGQPSLGDDGACFEVHGAERLLHVYEEVQGDPRVTHKVTLEADRYGRVVAGCEIGYARRTPEGPAAAAQGRVLGSAFRHETVSFDTADRFEVGIPVETREYELAGLAFTEAPTSFTSIRDAVTVVVEAAVAPHEDFGGTATQARLSSWERTLYADDASAALPFRSIGPRLLVHHEESACFTPQLVSNVFGARTNDAALTAAGYVRHDGAWWQREPSFRYGGPAAFFRLERSDRWDGGVTTIAYDPYRLVEVEIRDGLGNRSRADIDYHLVAPWQITDANGAVSEARYDPLGVPELATSYGQVRGQGNAAEAYGHEPLQSHVDQPDVSVDAFVADPARFVRQAGVAIAYDLDGWQNGRPVRVVRLARDELVYDERGPPNTGGRIHVDVEHYDGLMRPLQTKTLVEPGRAIQRDTNGRVVVDAAGTPIEAETAERWLASARAVRTAAGEPLREHEPFFSPSPGFEGDEELLSFGAVQQVAYDALGRAVREDYADGSFGRVEYRAWETRRHDRNDTVNDSLYRTLREGLPNGHPEKDALTKAQAHAETPAVNHLDALGRQIVQVTSTGAEELVVRTDLDSEGAPVTIVDARGVTAFRIRRDLLGRALRTDSADAGTTWLLPDALDRPAHSWDRRGVHTIDLFDVLDRPVARLVEQGGATRMVEDYRYGDDPPVANTALRNRRERLVRRRDDAGVFEVLDYDPFGNPLRWQRRLRADATGEPDWQSAAAVGLDNATYPGEAAYDALGRPIRAVLADGAAERTQYLRGGGIRRVTVTPPGGSELVVLDQASLDARGRRRRVVLGNGVSLEHGYDAESGRVATITGSRPAGALPARVVQDLRFTYDPSGNVVSALDAAQEPAVPSALLRGSTVTTRREFTYDAVYRLWSATGRVHQALLEMDFRPGLTDGNRLGGTRHLTLNNGQAVERYTRRYRYDASGNLTEVRHVGATRSWTTDIWVSPTSNRALPLRQADGALTTNRDSRFDATGNCIWLPHLRSLDWSSQGRLARAVLIDRSAQARPNDEERYVYDTDGNRLRKVTTRLVGGAVETTERLYLDTCEIKRVRRGNTLQLERFTYHVYDGDVRVALVHRWTVDAQRRETEAAPVVRARYSLSDHVGSSVLELDDQGGVIAYEEFFPYGASAFVAGDRERDVSAREFRFAGKERDEATALSYFGQRYYAPWLGRWISPDPAGLDEGLNLYAYAQDNPETLVDPEGLRAEVPQRFLPALEQIPAEHRPSIAAAIRETGKWHGGDFASFQPPQGSAPATRTWVWPTPTGRAALTEVYSGGKLVGVRVATESVDMPLASETGARVVPPARAPASRSPTVPPSSPSKLEDPKSDAETAPPDPDLADELPPPSDPPPPPELDPEAEAEADPELFAEEPEDPETADWPLDLPPDADEGLVAPTEGVPADNGPPVLVGGPEGGWHAPDSIVEEPEERLSLREEFGIGFAEAAGESLASKVGVGLLGPAGAVIGAVMLGDAMSKAYKEEGGGFYGVLGAANVLNPMYHLMASGWLANEEAGQALYLQQLGDHEGAAAHARASGGAYYKAAESSVELGMAVAGGLKSGKSMGIGGGPKLPKGPHGNFLGGSRRTRLYALYDKNTGRFLKWGITSNPRAIRRYASLVRQQVVMRILATGNRRRIARLERWLTERLPGPRNRERWAGSQGGPQGPAGQRRLDRYRRYFNDRNWPFTVVHW